VSCRWVIVIVHSGEGVTMGMSNEQFDAYKTRILRDLERAEEELKDAPVKSKSLQQLIEDLRAELKKP